MRWATLIAVVALGLPPLATKAQSRIHDTQITAPAQFDFTLASLTLRGPADGLRIITTGPADPDYVAAATERTAPQHIFILVVNNRPRDSLPRQELRPPHP